MSSEDDTMGSSKVKMYHSVVRSTTLNTIFGYVQTPTTHVIYQC